MYKHSFYLIETLTNTCVGSGEESFGDVDIIIQKDPVTSIPIFNSSSVKGALKELIRESGNDSIIKEIFEKSFVKFYEARLVLLPLRSSKKVFYYATSANTLLEYVRAIETFGGKETNLVEKLITMNESLQKSDKEYYVFDGVENLEVEEFTNYEKYSSLGDADATTLQNLLRLSSLDNIAVFKEEMFRNICEKSLPVIARNQIGKEGTSENLFYEEVLPRMSKLWLMIGFRDVKENNNFENIRKQLVENILCPNLVQFGANASIGYGVTRICEVIL